MRKILFASIALIAISCKDSFDIGKLNEPSKLSVCCFPSTADTTWIEVTSTLPVNKDNAASREAQYISDAHIIYKVNGEQREVYPVSEARSHQKPVIGTARYYVVGSQQPGDKVSIEVSAPAYETVTAETTIPRPCPIKAEGLHKVSVYSNSASEFRTVDQLTATFTDPAETRDYYAVRVCQMHVEGYAKGVGDPYYDDYDDQLHYRTEWHIGNSDNFYAVYLQERASHPELDWTLTLQDSAYIYREVGNESEPLLSPLSEMDEDFGFESNYYQWFYIFSDDAINGQTYTLHLNIRDNLTIAGHEFLRAYRAELYRITPEMYRYLKSINDVDNNKLAQSGFSMLVPTFSNVSRGVGILGGFALSTSEWITKTYQ